MLVSLDKDAIDVLRYCAYQRWLDCYERAR
jgi:hypothetical protein